MNSQGFLFDFDQNEDGSSNNDLIEVRFLLQVKYLLTVLQLLSNQMLLYNLLMQKPTHCKHYTLNIPTIFLSIPELTLTDILMLLP
jgi:hypothetical protein